MIPWFMHMHAGTNSGIGVYPTPVGTFVRSHGNGRSEAAWYPMGYDFSGGASRECQRIYAVSADDHDETALEAAVLDFMFAHPVLALCGAHDRPLGREMEWDVTASGVLATLETDDGIFVRIHHGDTVHLEFLPAGGRGVRQTLATFSDKCDDERLRRRVDARVERHIGSLRAKSETAS